MKKIISKVLIIFITIIIMFEFVFSSNICNATINVEYVVNGITNLAGGIVSILTWEKRVNIVTLAFAVDLLTAQVARESGMNTQEGLEDLMITPFNIFFNKYVLLDVNYFNFDINQNTVAYTFRTTVAKWYYAVRLIAIVILSVILLYVGIRMALSTLSEDKAKYKKMLIDWAASLALVFILHYIMIFIIYCNEAIISALQVAVEDETGLSNILVDIGLRGVLGIGITGLAAVAVFVGIVFYTILFLVSYINRVLKVGFLIMISPLISITYSIDKMKDGKAQALGTWLKEFIFTILIQPFHCIMYIAFVNPAVQLLCGTGGVAGFITIIGVEYNQLVNALLAILCLKFIKDGEAVIGKIFGFSDVNNSTSLGASMALGMMAINNVKKIGGVNKKVTNKLTNVSKLGNGIKSDILANPKIANNLNKLKNTNLGKNATKIGQGITKAGKGVKEAGKNIKGAITKPRRVYHGKLREMAQSGGIKGFFGSKMLEHNSLSSTLATIGGLATWFAGANAMAAHGTGSRIRSLSEGSLANSKKTLAEGASDAVKRDDEINRKQIDETINEDNEELEEAGVKIDEADKYENLKSKANDLDNSATEHENEAKELREKAEKLPENSKKRVKLESDASEHENKAQNLREEEREVRGKMSYMNEASGGLLEKRSGHIAERDNFWTKEATLKRMANRKPPSESELQAKKNEIVQKLKALKVAEKAKQNNTSDVSSVVLTEDEEDSIGKTSQMLINSIQKRDKTGIDKGKQRQLVSSQLGLSQDNQSGFNDLYKSTLDLGSMEACKEKMTYDSYASSLGIYDKYKEAETYNVLENSRAENRRAERKKAKEANENNEQS